MSAAKHAKSRRQRLSDAASAFTHCVTGGNNMPDGSFPRETRSRSAAQASMEPIEKLALAYRKAEDDLNESDPRREARNRIIGLYPKPPENVASFFRLNGRLEPLEHPAPVQEEALRNNANQWLTTMGDGSSAPCIQARALITDWHAWNSTCEAIYEREGGPALEEEEERLAAVWDEACERLVEAKTTSLLGILLKLEHAAAYDDFQNDLRERPNLVPPRVILGLIRDLKEDLGRA